MSFSLPEATREILRAREAYAAAEIHIARLSNTPLLLFLRPDPPDRKRIPYCE
jgi:hypothetical protein